MSRRPSDSIRWGERVIKEEVQPPSNCEWGFGFLIDCFVHERILLHPEK